MTLNRKTISMRHMKTLALSCLSALVLTACSGGAGEEETLASEPIMDCPADKILTNADYPALPVIEETDYAAWLTENAKNKDVMMSETGLQYTVVQEGLKDGASPVGPQVVTVHYHGYFTDGSVFDSSYERKQTIDFPANRVIKGWIEALQGMKTCEARTLYIPGDLAYGPQGRPGIPPNATLLFNVQLIGVKPL